jgi:uncharacterized protein
MESPRTCCTAFEGSRRIASGDLERVAVEAKRVIDLSHQEPVLIFDDLTSEVIEVDFRGTVHDVLKRLAQAATGAPATRASVERERETLLPKHWEWLNSQPGGASVALRKLVEEAKRVNAGRDAVRQAQEAAYRFMLAMAGDEPGFEEATRALFARTQDRFHEVIQAWPADVRDHARQLAGRSFQASGAT